MLKLIVSGLAFKHAAMDLRTKYVAYSLAAIAVPGIAYVLSCALPSSIRHPGREDDHKGPNASEDNFTRALHNASTWALAKQANSRYFDPLTVSTSLRLLRILPGAPDEQLACEFITLNAPSEFAFEAISYSWTSALPLNSIEAGQLAGFKITDHVERLLRRLRRASRDRVVWIDAICVNQEDLHERSCQVRIMRHIFASAEKVIVWLGEPPLGSRNGGHTDREILTADSNESRGISPLSIDGISCQGSEAWWMRVWVYQEVAVAKNVEVLVGGSLATWTRFLGDVESTYQANSAQQPRRGERNTDRKSMLTRLHAINDIRTKTQEAESRLLLSRLLITTSTVTASLKEDKIYALLGLAEPEYSQDITLQYARSIELLFIETLHSIVQRERSLDILASGWPILKTLNLSWLPDFSDVKRNNKKLPSSTRYFASGSSEAQAYLATAADPSRSFDLHAGVFENFRPNLSDLQNLRFVFKGLQLDTVVESVGLMDMSCERISEVNARERKYEYKLSWSGHGLESIASRISTRRHSETFSDGDSIPSMLLRDYSLAEATRPSSSDAESLVKTVLQLSLHTYQQSTYRSPHAYHIGFDNDYKSLQASSFWSKDPTLGDRLSADLPDYSVFVTATYGLVGAGPITIRKTDFVVVPFGASTPFVLRPVGEGFKFLGALYIEGAMYGKLVELNATFPEAFPETEYILA